MTGPLTSKYKRAKIQLPNGEGYIITDEFLQDAMDQCCNSWFGSHRDTQKQTTVSNQTRAGTKNELSTIQKLCTEQFV